MTWAEVYPEMADIIRPILDSSSRTSGVMRMTNGGRLDFWTLENQIAGRGRVGPSFPATQSSRSADRPERHSDSSQSQVARMVERTSVVQVAFSFLICVKMSGGYPDRKDPHWGWDGES